MTLTLPYILLVIVSVLIPIIAATFSGYFAAQMGVRVGLAKMEARHEFMDEEISSLNRGIGELNKDMAVVRYDLWSHDADIQRICEEVKINRVPRQRGRSE